MAVLRNITILTNFSKPHVNRHSKNYYIKWHINGIKSYLGELPVRERSEIGISLSVVKWQPFENGMFRKKQHTMVFHL